MKCTLVLVAVTLVSGTNLLQNPSFETGDSTPTSWVPYGNGSYLWPSNIQHTGKRCVQLGGSNTAEYYQRVTGATVGALYQVSVWAMFASGNGNGVVKVEFQDYAENKLNETSFPIVMSAADPWKQFSVSSLAPTGSTQVTASIVANLGSTLLFDDVSLDRIVTPSLAFDLNKRLTYPFAGFGAMVWADQTYGINEFKTLNIKWIRTTQDSASRSQMQAMRNVTDSLGIQWIYVLWNAPSQYCNSSHMLTDVDGFATYWVNLVTNLSQDGVCPHAIDLMNEPDSDGQWSTGITPSDYNSLVKSVRNKLDAAGYKNVTIFGPGMSNLGYNHNTQWIGALDSTAVNDLQRWASHAWDDQPGMPGAATMESVFPQYSNAANAKDATKPKFITEYATHNTIYNGFTYPNADQTVGYSVASTLPYAVRVIENTLAMLNQGAVSLYYWEAEDEPQKSWGYVDRKGNKKPIYYALLSFFPKLAVGSSIVVAPAQLQNDIYVSTSTTGTTILVAASNGGTILEKATVTLSNGPVNLKVSSAIAMVLDSYGNTTAGIMDTVKLIDVSISLTNPSTGLYTFPLEMPGLSTLVIELSF